MGLRKKLQQPDINPMTKNKTYTVYTCTLPPKFRFTALRSGNLVALF